MATVSGRMTRAYAPLQTGRDAEMAAEASPPGCPADRLRALVDEWASLAGGLSDQSTAFLRCAAAHPNTPPDVLARLLPGNADAFCGNPAAPLISLEPGAFLAGASEDGLLELLRWEAAPAPVVALLASGSGEGAVTKEVAEAARLHVAHSGEAGPGEWRASVAAHWRGRLQNADARTRGEVAEMVAHGFAPASLFPDGLPPLPTDEDPPTPQTMAALLRRGGHTPRGLPAQDMTSLFGGTSQRLGWWEALTRELWGDGDRPPSSPLARRIAGSKPVRRCLAIGLLRSVDPALRRLSLRSPDLPPAARAAYAVGLARASRFYGPSPPTYAPLGRRDLLGFLGFLHASGPEKVFEEFAFGRAWQGRLIASVCLSPHTEGRGPGLLRLLAGDGNRLVRAAAKARLRGEEFAWE